MERPPLFMDNTPYGSRGSVPGLKQILLNMGGLEHCKMYLRALEKTGWAGRHQQRAERGWRCH